MRLEPEGVGMVSEAGGVSMAAIAGSNMRGRKRSDEAAKGSTPREQTLAEKDPTACAFCPRNQTSQGLSKVLDVLASWTRNKRHIERKRS
jgi:hypothetical protein